MKLKPLAACALACMVSTPLLADDAPPNYFGLFGSYVKQDDVRARDDGIGAHLIYGAPLSAPLSLELGLFGHTSKTEATEESQRTLGLGIDLRYLLGPSRFAAFVLGGTGMQFEDYGSAKGQLAPYLDVGVGLQAGGEQLKLRGEARYYAIFDSETYTDEDVVFDARVNLGVLYSFAGDEPAAVETAAAAPAVDADSDSDGVPDSRDECPMTPAGVLVDSRGCPAEVPAAPINDDLDGDGVPNAQDECPDTPPGFKVNARGCVEEEQTVVVLNDVHFEFDSAKLTEGARRVLDRVVLGMLSQADLRIEIGGHTDALGTNAYNLLLSQRRANSVRDFLVDRGVDGSRLTVEGYGENNPVADNETEEGRARNRRVEFTVLKN
ncbi:MAG TPA: OmpA family protein [Solimonas sp.]|nr:OmpA family protein [Solimonas sp.]